jgi:hypothetical protein
MPVDFQCIFPQEFVKISQVKTVPRLPVRTLDIYGDDFRAVEDVLMNQVSVPSFVVLSKTRLLAEVPKPLVNSTITSISVLSRKLLVSPRSYIRFSIGRTPSKTRGILKLMQLFLKLLLTTPGTDIFAPKSGGGGLVHLGQSVGTNEGSDVVAGIIVSVDATARQIVQVQGRNQAIPPDERLLSAKVLSAGFNKNETAILVSIELTSQAGKSAVARFEA